jgi:TRAP-type C4-dicarboxylate transport system substrate-binding protein
MSLTRRALFRRASITAAGAIASPTILHWPANAAEFAYKCGTALPDGHPLCIRGREAAAKIKEESGGRLDITFYTNSVLGQDTAMISQTIAGALEM